MQEKKFFFSKTVLPPKTRTSVECKKVAATSSLRLSARNWPGLNLPSNWKTCNLVSGQLNSWPRWASTWAHDMVTWYWSADSWFWQVSIDSGRKNVESMRELRASSRPRNVKKKWRLFNFFTEKSRYASAGILVRSNNYSTEITSCTHTLLVLQFSQHFLNYKNRFEVLVPLAAWKEIAFWSPLLSWAG